MCWHHKLGCPPYLKMDGIWWIDDDPGFFFFFFWAIPLFVGLPGVSTVSKRIFSGLECAKSQKSQNWKILFLELDLKQKQVYKGPNTTLSGPVFIWNLYWSILVGTQDSSSCLFLAHNGLDSYEYRLIQAHWWPYLQVALLEEWRPHFPIDCWSRAHQTGVTNIFQVVAQMVVCGCASSGPLYIKKRRNFFQKYCQYFKKPLFVFERIFKWENNIMT